ncbi:MAG: hypothetical protein CM15mP79_1520 [Methanobacteriota archaeon]|nr:MAG: hypothetical protein CM15mP79_1520 [Euryarchaeota archaeon]
MVQKHGAGFVAPQSWKVDHPTTLRLDPGGGGGQMARQRLASGEAPRPSPPDLALAPPHMMPGGRGQPRGVHPPGCGTPRAGGILVLVNSLRGGVEEAGLDPNRWGSGATWPMRSYRRQVAETFPMKRVPVRGKDRKPAVGGARRSCDGKRAPDRPRTVFGPQTGGIVYWEYAGPSCTGKETWVC